VGSAYRETFLSPPFGGSWQWEAVDPGLAPRRPGLSSVAPVGLENDAVYKYGGRILVVTIRKRASASYP